MGGFIHLSMSAHHTPWRYLGIGVIKKSLQMILHLLLQMLMVKVVWVLGPLTLPPINMTVGLMVELLCHLGVGIIQQWSI